MSLVRPIRTVTSTAPRARSRRPYTWKPQRVWGATLAGAGIGIVYGGGSQGSMGRLAAGALGAGGKVVGILPRFMDELEWGHRSLTELRVVDSMHERKQLMLELADAVVALPGGCESL